MHEELISNILTSAAYYAWCDEWANHNDRLHAQGNPAYVSLAGARIEDYAPPTPADSWLDDWHADDYGPCPKLRAWLSALPAEAIPEDISSETLGYYLVMEALGHGVSLDDHYTGVDSWHDIGRRYNLPLPSIEAPSWFGEPGAEDHEHGAWRWVDGASETEIRGCLDALGFETSGDGADRRGLMALMRDGDVALDDVSAYFDGLYPGQ